MKKKPKKPTLRVKSLRIHRSASSLVIRDTVRNLKKMSMPERYRIMVAAKLMTPDECEEATKRYLAQTAAAK
jgi:hypothetical protein